MSQKKDRILFFNKSTFKVAEVIFNKPTKRFHLRELARTTTLSTTAVKDSIDKLEEFKIIKTEETELATIIQANLDSKEYHDYKTIFNLYRLKRYGLDEELIQEYNPKCIVLFGSFAKGEDIEQSDIDILIVTNKTSTIKLDKYERALKRKINLHLLKNLENSKPEFKNEVANGIVLHGYVKVI